MNLQSARRKFSIKKMKKITFWNLWNWYIIDVPEEFAGSVIQKLSNRKGELQGMSPSADGTTRLEFNIPARGLIGYRGEFMTDTKGNGIMNSTFDGYGPSGRNPVPETGFPDRF